MGETRDPWVMAEGEASPRKAPELYLQPPRSSQGPDGETKAPRDVGELGSGSYLKPPVLAPEAPPNRCSLGPGASVVEEEADGEALTLAGSLALLPRRQSPGCSLRGHFSGLHPEGGAQRDLAARCEMWAPQAQGSSAVTQTSRVHGSHLGPYRITQGPGGPGDPSKHDACSLQWSRTLASSSSVCDADLGCLTSFKRGQVRARSPEPGGPPPAVSDPSP